TARVPAPIGGTSGRRVVERSEAAVPHEATGYRHKVDAGHWAFAAPACRHRQRAQHQTLRTCVCKTTDGLRNTEAITDESDKDVNVEPDRRSADEDELAKGAFDDILEDADK
ncbi:unnamed protein product, partial [Urochloa humidicola]